jgi:hypothetical protein
MRWVLNKIAVAQHAFPTALRAFNGSPKLVVRISAWLIIETYYATHWAAGTNVETLNDFCVRHWFFPAFAYLTRAADEEISLNWRGPPPCRWLWE